MHCIHKSFLCLTCPIYEISFHEMSLSMKCVVMKWPIYDFDNYSDNQKTSGSEDEFTVKF